MRPRAITSRFCIACRARTPEAAAHRYHHRRADKRRADWRRYKRRLKERTAAVGWLHELACDGNHAGNMRCRPVPVYRKEPA